MIKAVLVDDEADCLYVLKDMLKTHCGEVTVIGEADGVEKALEIIESNIPDLLFLDIAINGENAFDLLDRLTVNNFEVIFTTAWNDHATEAFKYSAIDYLLKPLDGDELRKAVDKVIKRSAQKDLDQQLKVLVDNMHALQVTKQKMAIPVESGLTFVYLMDILRLEAHGSNTIVHLYNGDRIESTRLFKEYADLLPEGFFYRVHNSHIVNVNKVKSYQKSRGGNLIMEDGSIIEVAFRRREDFMRRLLK